MLLGCVVCAETGIDCSVHVVGTQRDVTWRNYLKKSLAALRPIVTKYICTARERTDEHHLVSGKYPRTACYVPAQPVMSPHSLLCPRTACYVPAQPVMSPHGLLCPRTACYVPARPGISPHCLACPRTACYLPARPVMSPHSLLCPCTA